MEVIHDCGHFGTPYHGAKADVWSAGVILFILVKGEFPFEEVYLFILFLLYVHARRPDSHFSIALTRPSLGTCALHVGHLLMGPSSVQASTACPRFKAAQRGDWFILEGLTASLQARSH